MRETQNKITGLLRLDYDTFINSSFLLQNRADEFTIKTPAERKQVLSDILGLEQWEVYEERAKERVQHIATDIERIKTELDRIDEELAQRPRYEAELSSARAAVIALGDRLRQAEEAWQRIQSDQRDAGHLDTQLAELATRVAQAEREWHAVESDLSDAMTRADADALRAQLAAVQAELQKLDARESARDQARVRNQRWPKKPHRCEDAMSSLARKPGQSRSVWRRWKKRLSLNVPRVDRRFRKRIASGSWPSSTPKSKHGVTNTAPMPHACERLPTSPRKSSGT